MNEVSFKRKKILKCHTSKNVFKNRLLRTRVRQTTGEDYVNVLCDWVFHVHWCSINNEAVRSLIIRFSRVQGHEVIVILLS